MNASSGAVTVIVSGSNTLTCTVGTASTCSDNSSFSVADGNIITISVTSQLLETLADMSIMFELWN